VQPPAAPKAAPFFLPLQTGLDPKFVLPAADSAATAASSRLLYNSVTDTPLIAAMRASQASGDCASALCVTLLCSLQT
jgi:hypothetical protein